MTRTTMTNSLISIAMFAAALSADAADLNGDFLTAACSGDVAQVQQLLADGADVNVRDTSGNAAIHYAAALGFDDVAQILVDAGADIDARGRIDNTPLHMAAQENHASVAAILISHGADVNAENEFGGTALVFATGWGHQDIVDQLQQASQPLYAFSSSVWFVVLLSTVPFAAVIVAGTRRFKGRSPVSVASTPPASVRTIPHNLLGIRLRALHSNDEMAS